MSMVKKLLFVVLVLVCNMVQHNLVFDKVADLSEVDQFGYIDLSEAISIGTVSSVLKIEDTAFNNIDDPGSIIGKPRDVFEAYKMGSLIHERGKKEDPAT